MRFPVRPLVAAGLLLTAACAVLPAPRLAAPPELETVRDLLLHDEATAQTVRGLARVGFDGPRGSGSATQAVVVALPDRARVEVLTPLGTTALVATLRAEELRVHSPIRHEYSVGRATRETLARLVMVPVPPACLLRLLAGLPPLPVRAQDPRLTLVAEGPVVRVETVDGEYWQRLWTGTEDPGVARGEVGRASELLLTFSFADRRLDAGTGVPLRATGGGSGHGEPAPGAVRTGGIERAGGGRPLRPAPARGPADPDHRTRRRRAGPPGGCRPVNEVVIPSPAKINLFLEIVSRRPDGYHEIESIMQLVDLCDEVRLRRQRRGIRVQVSGAELPEGRGNLAYRAAALLLRGGRGLGRGRDPLDQAYSGGGRARRRIEQCRRGPPGA